MICDRRKIEWLAEAGNRKRFPNWCVVCEARVQLAYRCPAMATPLQKDSIMRKYLSVTFARFVVIVGASSFLSACNTVEGAGKDVSHAGHEVSEEANEHK